MSKGDKPGVIVIEGHVQGLANTRALGEQGIPVFVLDKNLCLARYSKFCKKFFRCPDYLAPEFITFLLNLAKQHNLRGWSLFPSNDHAVYNISKNKEKLGSFYKVISPDLDIFNNIYNKGKLLNIADDLKLPIPNTYYPADSNDEISKLQFTTAMPLYGLLT